MAHKPAIDFFLEFFLEDINEMADLIEPNGEYYVWSVKRIVAYQPMRSPFLSCLTSGPTASTTPTPSWPSAMSACL